MASRQILYMKNRQNNIHTVTQKVNKVEEADRLSLPRCIASVYSTSVIAWYLTSTVIGNAR